MSKTFLVAWILIISMLGTIGISAVISGIIQAIYYRLRIISKFRVLLIYPLIGNLVALVFTLYLVKDIQVDEYSWLSIVFSLFFVAVPFVFIYPLGLLIIEGVYLLVMKLLGKPIRRDETGYDRFKREIKIEFPVKKRPEDID